MRKPDKESNDALRDAGRNKMKNKLSGEVPTEDLLWELAERGFEGKLVGVEDTPFILNGGEVFTKMLPYE